MASLFDPSFPEHLIFSVEPTVKPSSQTLGEIMLPLVADSPNTPQSI